MAYLKSSHVMVICSYKLITCQHIRTHILTSKHVTLSQAMTHPNKSHNGPRSKPQQSQTRPRDRPQTGHKHRLRTVAGSPRRSGSLRRATTSPKGNRMSPFPVRPEKFQFLEYGQKRNFNYEIVITVKNP